MADYDSKVRALVDKASIQDVLTRYVRAVDRCDKELLRSVFHPGAHESHGGIFEGTAEDFCDLCMDKVKSFGRVAHYLSIPIIELEGDVALCETYIIAWHRVEHGRCPYDVMFGGRLLDRFERREGEWRVAARRVVYDWNRDTPTQETWGMRMFGQAHAESRKDHTDPLYAFLGRKRL